MSELQLVRKSDGITRVNVLFVHGLNGESIRTWQSSAAPPEFWPSWLVDDIDGISVWTVGYPAEGTHWFSSGYAMAISDRAANLLSAILANDQLLSGEIVLIGHSMGGLIIKQLVRIAEGLAYSKVVATELLAKIRRIGFVATPHQGSGKASLVDKFRILTRPTAATAGLIRNDPALRELNLWYREWAQARQIQHLILAETLPTRPYGMIVDRDSSDPGLRDQPTPIDADHFSICKPSSKRSLIYVLIRNFLSSQTPPSPQDGVLRTLAEHSAKLEKIVEGTNSSEVNITKVINELRSRGSSQPDSKVLGLLHKELQTRLDVLRRGRFFRSYNRVEEALRLAQELRNGYLSNTDAEQRAIALAWCARILCTFDLESAINCWELSSSLAKSTEGVIAQAFISRLKGDFASGIRLLAAHSEKISRSAAFMLTVQEHGIDEAVRWLHTSQLNFSMLDSDGKFYYTQCHLEAQKWEAAALVTSDIHQEDYSHCPALLAAVAFAKLSSAVPEKLNFVFQQGIPFDLRNFPLHDTKDAILQRGESRDLFARASHAADEFGLQKEADFYGDLCLWLTLRDRNTHQEGIALLKSDLTDPSRAMRRLNFLFSFGLKVNLFLIEQEIERQEALNGAATDETAVARLVIALNRDAPKSALIYLRSHKEKLRSIISKEILVSLEIRMLIQNGLINDAQQIISSIVEDGPLKSRLASYQLQIQEYVDENSGLEKRIRAYRENPKLEDLDHLVQTLFERKDWERTIEFGLQLFEETRSARNAEVYVIALENCGEFQKLGAFLEENTYLLDHSDDLLSAWSWAKYRDGEFSEAANALATLCERRSSSRDRSLQIQLAISSGDWDSLAEYCEKQWRNRENLNATELLQTAYVAQSIGLARAKELSVSAVSLAPNDPTILIGAYMLATESGWDDDPMVSKWLEKAHASPSEGNPLQTIALEELIAKQPAWNEHAARINHSLATGATPAFVAAKTLNRTLLSLLLTPSLQNPLKSDVRRRVPIPVFSGNRQPIEPASGSIALEISAIILLARFDLLSKLLNNFNKVFIAHSTLKWLFEERRKIPFHQPSQVIRAETFRGLISAGDIEVMPAPIIDDPDLIAEVGLEHAYILTDAHNNCTDGQKHFVVTTYPIRRVSVLIDDVADVTKYTQYLCSTFAILLKMHDDGLLTSSEKYTAEAYLEAHEKQWPTEPKIPDNSTLYLDELSLIHLYHAKILKFLRLIKCKIIISPDAQSRINGLLERSATSREELDIINNARGLLRENILTGKISVLPSINDVDVDSDLIHHPTAEIVRNSHKVDNIVLDDRYLNRNFVFKDDISHGTVILTTPDIVDALFKNSVLSMEEYLDIRTQMRRAGCYFIPPNKQELLELISRTEVSNGKIIETSFLKTLREYNLKARADGILNPSNELQWIHIFLGVSISLISEQWQSEIDEGTAAARSDWLLAQIDPLKWASLFREDKFTEIEMSKLAENHYELQCLILLSRASEIKVLDRRQKYWDWLECSLLSKVRHDFPSVYVALLGAIKDLVIDVVHNTYEKFDDEN